MTDHKLVEYDYVQVTQESSMSMHMLLTDGLPGNGTTDTATNEPPLIDLPISWSPIFMGLIATVTLLRRRK